MHISIKRFQPFLHCLFFIIEIFPFPAHPRQAPNPLIFKSRLKQRLCHFPIVEEEISFLPCRRNIIYFIARCRRKDNIRIHRAWRHKYIRTDDTFTERFIFQNLSRLINITMLVNECIASKTPKHLHITIQFCDTEKSVFYRLHTSSLSNCFCPQITRNLSRIAFFSIWEICLYRFFCIIFRTTSASGNTNIPAQAGKRCNHPHRLLTVRMALRSTSLQYRSRFTFGVQMRQFYNLFFWNPCDLFRPFRRLWNLISYSEYIFFIAFFLLILFWHRLMIIAAAICIKKFFVMEVFTDNHICHPGRQRPIGCRADRNPFIPIGCRIGASWINRNNTNPFLFRPAEHFAKRRSKSRLQRIMSPDKNQTAVQ